MDSVQTRISKSFWVYGWSEISKGSFSESVVRLTNTCIPIIAIFVARAAVQLAFTALTCPLNFHGCLCWL